MISGNASIFILHLTERVYVLSILLVSLFDQSLVFSFVHARCMFPISLSNLADVYLVFLFLLLKIPSLLLKCFIEVYYVLFLAKKVVCPLVL